MDNLALFIVMGLLAWLLLGAVIAVVVGRSIRRADLKSPSLTDDELEACQFIRSAPPSPGIKIIELDDRHRLLVDRGNHTVTRIHNGQRTELDWPLALS